MINFDAAMEVLLEAIRTEYRGFHTHKQDPELDDTRHTMIDEFSQRLSFKKGRKYTKVILDKPTRVWGFVVNEDDSKFKKGDILKAAGYSTPTRNAARGNIFDGYRVDWTGPHYIRN